ncbi:MAG: hypothetical protein WDW38_006619 [Sanguina aurantia]
MIIGLVGRRGTGKDTVAEYLVQRHGFENRKFAGPLKKALSALFGFTDRHLEGDLKEAVHPAWGVSPRVMMQFFGTEIMQKQMQRLIPAMGSEHAVRRMFMDVDVDVRVDKDHRTGGSTCKDTRMVVSDVRFPHEVAALRARGGLIVRVHRQSLGLACSLDSTVDSHVSEAGLDDLVTDLHLDNNHSREWLYAAVDIMIHDVRVRGLGPS